MTEPEFQVHVIAGRKPREEWAQTIAGLVADNIDIVTVVGSPEKNRDVSEELTEPLWVAEDDFFVAGEGAGIVARRIHLAWNGLAKLHAVSNHPDIAKDEYWFLAREGRLPIKFFALEAADAKKPSFLVDALSLKVTAQEALARLAIRRRNILWEYFGVEGIGEGIVRDWNTIAGRLLAG